ncbi:MAG: UDP-N-acetylmuramoyl-tripeptide--D-alanyl-D-alanine ligase [Helicobacteraceae bacterium]|nr:UDP-N-acetylmuramoyl-tripeptide--D-alanyl-D-alanine ligase [Helicobacteraceae bacterium]
MELINGMLIFNFVTNIIFVLTLGWYLITLLQWYDYRVERVFFKHHKPLWHIIYFLIPLGAYYSTGDFFGIFFYFAVLPSIYLWNKKLDKKLVLTWRVKRFFILLFGLTLFQNFLCTLKEGCELYGVFIPLLIAVVGSIGIEKFLYEAFKKNAIAKLTRMENLKIICITGSYGKTSIKNFTTQLLKEKYTVHSTPRSVNTVGGIIRDINENLDEFATQVYVCEAGARERGDIYKIAQLLNPHIVIVGEVGEQHLEYFKTLDNIKRTKLELLQSNRLEIAYVHHSVTSERHDRVQFFGNKITNMNATLDGTSFDVVINYKHMHLETSVLGSFQATNINAAALVADRLNFYVEDIVSGVKALESVEHRLQRIDAGGKIILDDGYNGNIEGMREGIRLCSLHNGRKVIVTPGLVESSDKLNLELISEINKVFDVVIVTGKLNATLFDKNLKVAQKIMLNDKATLTKILAQMTYSGDIIYFANDAPNFI